MVEQTPASRRSVPPGPSEKFDAGDLFSWLNQNFRQYGEIFKASIYGSEVYVISAPGYCEHVLRRNWENYPRKGLVVQRIALALGNNLITSNGGQWASQRRMIQPAFTKSAVHRLSDTIIAVNSALLQRWKDAARLRAPVNVTRDVSRMVFEITLRSIFGDDYEAVAPKFEPLAEELHTRYWLCSKPRLAERTRRRPRGAKETGEQNFHGHSRCPHRGARSGARETNARSSTGERDHKSCRRWS